MITTAAQPPAAIAAINDLIDCLTVTAIALRILVVVFIAFFEAAAVCFARCRFFLACRAALPVFFILSADVLGSFFDFFKMILDDLGVCFLPV